ncbi:cellulose synthase family protein [Spirosoma endophyticum]|uniref:Glycosyltransferase, catalytic subunit of cellulose synthase and poly-beta-1,6-N-acetylglucosamine synthase n=1 Tax=Spirosoma endophyticum TaxID=662367 RepID=A0A1I1XNG7_9BACT|nr:cellulose synthase family protein [Spirosoma endophyticum]SFE08909.1 Glycosyltransferase, catalytic subunit of cellulose synthase and poly-beta-1,6-N-acetylglucosamine synthase [Spirosoma endophyticum]
MEILVLLLYGLALMLLFFYNCGQLSLIIIYIRSEQERRKAAHSTNILSPDKLPRVTVQLPIYNELYVVERLIDAIVRLEYPKDKLDIQLLDDSTDETVELIARKVNEYKQQGFDIEHVRRPVRTGFKAGALAYGLEFAKGEFIAIFDADFVPDPEFLIKTIPNFADPKVGIVQTRWEHLNEDFSLMTQLQAFGLNAHFTIEQSGRNAAGFLANFNGTGGVWRKVAIADAGGWQSDTLTEDLDLSYRAQLRGWKFVYREDIGSPAELPVAMNALKSQQYRWMKGAAECARKLFGKVLRTPGVSFTMKLHAFFHLFSSATFILVLILGVMSVPLIYIRSHHPEWEWVFYVINLFQFNLLILITFYGIPLWFLKPTTKTKLVWYFPMYSSLMMGLSLHNTIAVIEGYIGRKTPFVRTPKFNVTTSADQWDANVYVSRRVNWLTVVEGFLSIYFLGGLVLAVYIHDFRMFFLHIMLMVGFGMVFIYSIVQAGRRPGVIRA